MAACAKMELDVTFIGDSNDRSGNKHNVTLHGHAAVDVDGAHFDGDGDYIMVAMTPYSEDGSFTIAFWMTKTACTTGVYEYAYSHNKLATTSIVSKSNPNVNIYIGCETSGGGWSTLGGSVIRYNLIDDAGTAATFDYPLHDAGNFDAITALWIQVVLVVNNAELLTFDDGMPVPDSEYGFYVGSTSNATNAAYPHPGQLQNAFGKFTMSDTVYIGGRSDLSKSRHFVGRLAGLMVSKTAFSEDQAECVFKNGEEFLPSFLAECSTPPKTELSVSFLDDVTDKSGNNRVLTPHGNATSKFNGAQFGGDGDYVTVANFEYASDAAFTVAFWMTKETCTGGVYEYLYSHHNNNASGTMYKKAFVNIFLACEAAGGGWSSLGGSVIRYNVRSNNTKDSSLDFPLHSAGDFDSITSTWVHVVMSVTPKSIVTYDDGVKVADTAYGFYKYGSARTNNARPTPSNLTMAMDGLSLLTDVYLGGRADANKARHFVGKMALVQVLTTAVTDKMAECMFLNGDETLPSAVAVYRHSSKRQQRHCCHRRCHGDRN